MSNGCVAPRAFVIGLVLAGFTTAGAASTGEIILSSGAFSQRIPIQVPAFHGLEPKLALSYSSQGGNSLFGAGWSLGGISTIEWSRPGGGAPNTGVPSAYFLDGQELIPCQQGSVSPSCTTGGTHSTKIESYLKIKFDSVANTWTVWGRDGTKTTFSPTLLAGSFTFRWGQTSVIDTYGNAVTYNWLCVDGPDCYPSTIAYNGYVITLYRETRPDPLTFATGYSVGRTLYRIRSLIARLGTSFIRGYKLTYTTSPVTGRSLLASVQQYGTDLTHTAGLFTGGTTLPAQTFTYQNDALGQTFQTSASSPPTQPMTVENVVWWYLSGVSASGLGNSLTRSGGSAWDAGASSSRAIESGHGWMEYTYRPTPTAVIGLSNGDANVGQDDVDFAFYQSSGAVYVRENGVVVAGPWTIANGARLTVEVALGHVTYRLDGVSLYMSTRTATYPLVVDTSIYNSGTLENVTISGALIDVAPWCAGGAVQLADFNGDGKTDQLCYGPAGVTRVRLATADGFGSPVNWLSSWALNQIFVADVNDDGMADLIDYEGDYFWVALSTGSAFAAPVSWGHSGALIGEDGWAHACQGGASIGLGEFNGDGVNDVSCRVSDGTMFVGLSSGLAFNFTIWGTSSCWGPTGFGDFNGDGKTDWYCIDGITNAFSGRMSTGSSFNSGGPYVVGSYCAAVDYIVGDLNGDGKTDVSCKGNGNVALSDGYSFIDYGSFGGWCTSSTNVFAGDFDGDGIGEIVCNTSSAPANDIEVRRWQGLTLGAAQTWKGNWCTGNIRAGDFNGDGKTDLYCEYLALPAGISGTGGVRADLMTTSANGLGGTSEIAYTPSTSFTNTNNPPPKHVVTSVTTADGRGGSSTTTYTYSGGAIARAYRQPLGFASAQTTLPQLGYEGAAPLVETSFRQDLGSVGKLSNIKRRDSAGHLLTQRTYVYTTNEPTVPRTSLLTEEWSYTYDGSGLSCQSYPCPNGKRTHDVHQYDVYGNRLQTDFSGDEDAPNDEKTIAWQYRPNTTAYIVDRVAFQRHYGPGMTMVRSARWAYDGQTDPNQPPLKGSPTQSIEWLDTPLPARWVTTSTTVYDSFGNPTSVTDATGRAVTTAYESTYHVFPTRVTNGAGEWTSATWDPICGVPSQQTALARAADPAGPSTTFQWDTLCRSTRVDRPLGAFEIRSYVGLGSPSSQRLTIETPSGADPQVKIYSHQYFDGLGREYRSVRKGPSPAKDIVIDTTYDARSQVASRTAPYYAADPAFTTNFRYDALGRLTRTTHPDGNFRATTHGLWRRDDDDEHQGHITNTVFDAYGRVSVKEQHINGQTLPTQFAYDPMDRLVGMTDPAGNVWSWTFDWLGRNIARQDPDSGTWTFAYDDASRVTLQTDAKTQQTTFTYDNAGRPATKVNAAGTVTTSWSQARAGSFNTGQVTTVTSPAATLTSDYDALGRAVNQVRTLDGQNYSAQRRYDAASHLTGITYPDGDTVGTTVDPLTYDAAGRLKTIPGIVSEILYNAVGAATNQTNVNGTVTARAYSPERGFLTDITTTEAGTIQELGYVIDAAGMASQVTSPLPDEQFTYTYDDLHRLTDAASPTQSQSFTYEAQTGNITYNSRVGAYSYPSAGSSRPHAPTSVAGSPTFTYDNNGNLESGNGRAIQWTADNLPSQVGTTQFTYDGIGERVKKTSSGSSSLYPFGDDYEITNGTITKYVSVEGLGVIAKRVGSTTYWLHTDRLGSVQAITDAIGSEVQHRTYRPYGDKSGDTTSHAESRGYIGERQDTDTGLTYLHARYYDPALGIFLSPDPIGAGGNAFAYSGGDPINATDPAGLCHDGYYIIRYDEQGQPYTSLVCPTGDVHQPGNSNWLTGNPSQSEDEGSRFRERQDRRSERAAERLARLAERQRQQSGGSGGGDDGGGGGGGGGCEGPKCPRFSVTVDVVAEPDVNSIPGGVTLSYFDAQQRLAAFWDGVIPGNYFDPFSDLYQNCAECWFSEEAGEWTRNAEMTLALGNNNPFLRFGPGWKRFPDGSARPIWRFASGGRFGKGGPKLPWHWHWP
jgi:RHS repeat-associated protein